MKDIKKNWNIEQVSSLGKEKILLPLLKKKKKNNTKQTKNNETGKIRVEKVRLALEMHTDYLPLPPSLERLPPAIFNLY